MNETLKKWIDALRSGEYKQTTETLCDDNGGYCCLGVLEHMLTGDVERETNAYIGRPAMMLSHNFSVEHGFLRGDMFGTGISAWQLSEMNDNGSTFEDIAQHLEDHAPK